MITCAIVMQNGNTIRYARTLVPFPLLLGNYQLSSKKMEKLTGNEIIEKITWLVASELLIREIFF